MIEANIFNSGSCFHLIKNEIYGKVEHPDYDEASLLAPWESFTDDLERIGYSTNIAAEFRDSFNQGQAGSTIFKIFCSNLIDVGLIYDLSPDNYEMKKLLREKCDQNAWRFRAILHTGSTDFCDYGSYPSEYKPHLKANELDPENCE